MTEKRKWQELVMQVICMTEEDVIRTSGEDPVLDDGFADKGYFN